MITVPSNLDQAVERLATLEGIATATGWERAAIVYAFVDRPGTCRKQDQSKGALISTHDFAAFGIVGLKSQHTVERYYDAWKFAITHHGAAEVEPGGTVELPTAEWPPEYKYLNREKDPDKRERIRDEAEAAGISPNMVAYVRENPSAISAAIKADPRIAEVADRALDERFADAQKSEREQRKAEPKTEPEIDWSVEEAYTLAVKHLLNAGIEVRKALRLVTTQPRHDGEVVDVVARSAKENIERLSMLISFVESGGEVDDAALQAFMVGGDPS